MDGQVQYAQTLKEINGVINTAGKEYNNHVSAMGKDANATEKLRAEKKKLEIQLEGAEKRSKLLREEYERSVKETGEYSNESKKLYNQLQQSETGENKLRDALDQTNEAIKEQGDLSVETAKKLEKIEEAGEKVTNVGKGMTMGVTAPILAIGAASLAAFGEVDEALDTIIKKTGATGEVADSLSESFKNVGKGTHLELQTVGEAIGEVNTQFGFMGEELEEATDYMLKFADINDTDVSQSAINSRKAIEAYEMSYDDLNVVLDATTQVAQDTGQSVDDLFDKAIKGAPQIKALGLTFEDGVEMIGKFEQSGVESTKALSYMSKASVVFAKDGKTLTDGLSELQTNMQNASSDTEALTMASEVFGTKGASVMFDAIQRGSLDLTELGEVAKNSGGAVGTTFESTLDPIDKAQLAMNNAKIAMAEVGDTVQIALEPMLVKVTEALQKLGDWWSSLTPEMQQFIVKASLVAAAIGPLLVVVGTLMGSVTKLYKGVQTFVKIWQGMQLLLAANPFILIVAAVIGLIAIFVLAYKKIEWFRNGVNTFFGGIKDFGVNAFKFLGGYISGIFDGIVQNFKNFYDSGKRIFTGLIDFITGVFTGNWSKAWSGIIDIFGGIFDGIGSMVKVPLNFMIGLINGFLRGLSKIKIPDWVPGVGGKGFSISEIPLLAKGGSFLNGQAIVGEAGPELVSSTNGRTKVTPLSNDEKNKGISGATRNRESVTINNHFGQINTNSPSELAKLDRRMKRSADMGLIGNGGVPG
ncbi:phage tail tape measure protein [Vagococcus salmoninarum]|uniref:phage tail tape measure protein n=1 Tax=Vagococcus salmoninarum TaxID=2739 RepID=UPI00188155BF|nr:phage tail tape measure protein [Vagococcus salmoninarum]MBE9390331.1 phage tail tape measure protein [Vagococcus salmoninarum]